MLFPPSCILGDGFQKNGLFDGLGQVTGAAGIQAFVPVFLKGMGNRATVRSGAAGLPYARD